jgi:hypothetical protein
MLDEDTFNLEVRKLLKTFGVGAQRLVPSSIEREILWRDGWRVATGLPPYQTRLICLQG